MKYKAFILLAVIALMSACGSKQSYKEYTPQNEEYRWDPSLHKTFSADGSWEIVAEQISKATYDSLYAGAQENACELIDEADERYPEAFALACRAALGFEQYIYMEFEETVDSLQAAEEAVTDIYLTADRKHYIVGCFDPISEKAFMMDLNGKADTTILEATFALGKNCILAGVEGWDCDERCEIWLYHMEKDRMVRFARYSDFRWILSPWAGVITPDEEPKPVIAWINDTQLLCYGQESYQEYEKHQHNDSYTDQCPVYYLLTLRHAE